MREFLEMFLPVAFVMTAGLVGWTLRRDLRAGWRMWRGRPPW